MTRTLVSKLLRDLRLALLAVATLLCLFQFLWARVTGRILGKLAPFFTALANLGGLSNKDIEEVVFEGPGKFLRTVIGGERVSLDSAMDMLSIGYVHPLMVTVFCIWGVGRAAGAVAGEIDKGTMELLFAQPVARWRLIFAHWLVDLITIPLLALSLWAGNWIGAWAITPIEIEKPSVKLESPMRGYIVELGPLKLRFDDPIRRGGPGPTSAQRQRKLEERLRVDPMQFAPALWLVGGLIFAICGGTMWLSSAGRSRWRVLGIAVFVVLLQFLVNVLGQMWEPVAWMRPLTVFYYYQPQQVILFRDWCVTLSEWNGGSSLFRVPMPVVLYGVGLVGYAMALRTLVRRDLPAPL
jgi:ABC-2 type transport system permease protein